MLLSILRQKETKIDSSRKNLLPSQILISRSRTVEQRTQALFVKRNISLPLFVKKEMSHSLLNAV